MFYVLAKGRVKISAHSWKMRPNPIVVSFFIKNFISVPSYNLTAVQHCYDKHNLIPEQYHAFYRNLKYDAEIVDADN